MYYRLIVKREHGWEEIARYSCYARSNAIEFFGGWAKLNQQFGSGRWSVKHCESPFTCESRVE